MNNLNVIPQLRARSFIHQSDTGFYLTDVGRSIRLKLTAPAASVIDLCDGALDLKSIIVEAAVRFGTDPNQLEPKLVSLFERLQEMELVTLLPPEKRFRLRSIVMELTGACNLSCSHCIYAGRSGRNQMLDPAIVDRASAEMICMGVEEVYLSGGEPTLHPSIIEIIDTLKRNGIKRVVLLSNGQIINWLFANLLKRAGVDQVRISVDGTTALVNDCIRGEGSYSRAVQALSNLREVGVATGLVYTACKLNRGDWAGLVNFARNVADALFAGEVVEWGRAKESEAELALSPVDVTEFRLLLANARLFQTVEGSSFLVNPENVDSDYRRGMCAAGREKATITWRGTVIPCSLFDEPEMVAGDLHEVRLMSIWTESQVFRRLRELSVWRFAVCGGCRYRLICGGGCRAKSYAIHGILEGPPCPSDCSWRGLYFQQVTDRFGAGATEFIEGSGKQRGGI